MKKILPLLTVAVLLSQGCSKDPASEGILPGAYPVTVVYDGSYPDGRNGIRSFSHSYEGTIDISSRTNGIAIAVEAQTVVIKATLDKTARSDGHTIYYQATSVKMGQQPAYLEYTPADGKFRYSQSEHTGMQGSSNYTVSGQQ